MSRDGDLPPQPPALSRRIRLTTVQRWGLPVLFAIPVLALFGTFGERYTDVRGTGGSLAATFHYPSRIHYRQPLSFRLLVQNTGATPMDSVMVTLDPRFMRAFTSVRLAAPFRAPYAMELGRLGAGESRTVTGEVSGDAYWRSQGTIQVTGSHGMIQLPVSTFVYP